MPVSNVENIDCMIAMQKFPNQFFDLAVVDVPYGIGESRNIRGGTQYGKAASVSKDYGSKEWDSEAPSSEYFNELFRVSKNQIVWGANHFITRMALDSSCWIVWDKENGNNGYADCELAWTSFGSAVRKVKYRWHGMLQENMRSKEDRIHPTQKPIGLYKWLLKNYAKPNDKILDTHLGSGSSRIAAYKMGFDFWGYEIDKDYLEAQEKRFKTAIAEPLFESVKAEQQSFFNQ